MKKHLRQEGNDLKGESEKLPDTVPIARFDLDNVPAEDRFSIWKESISVIFDVEREVDGGSAPFAATLTTCHLGSMLLVDTSSIGQYFQRKSPLIARDGLDHCIIQVYQNGTTRGEWGKRHSTVQPGDVFLLDLTQPLDSCASDFRNLTLMLPRDLLAPHLGAPERLHDLSLARDSARGRLLGQHIRTLWEVATTLSSDEAHCISQGLVQLIGAYFGEGRVEEDRPETGAALLETVRRHIADHLGDPRLTPESLAAYFRVSRSYLYSLFQPLGGITRHIQQQRLRRAYLELTRPSTRPRRISEIAYRVGYRNEAHFSRSFRHAFGMSPSEARSIALQDIRYTARHQDHPIDRRHERWVRELNAPDF
ncbi:MULTISPECIES: helix-turn-helix domain-containing protein [Methylococcus]|uniref:helix-turn-helix domain-containing protein n=1 Tax=Methylococcus TaxID=413 RepID=UPI0024068758|nr:MULTISPECIES: helix-turn-helix domain-containing protein [Methylococcus]